MPSQRTEVYALRYGTRDTTKSDVYLNYDVYGEPDTPLGMDYYLWVVRRGERVVVVDCGYNAGSGGRRGRTMLVDPVEGLRRLGVRPDAVDALVVTHAHYDHIGNLDAFPATPLVIARAEYEFWTGPDSRHELFQHSAEPADLALLGKAADAGRVRFVTGSDVVLLSLPDSRVIEPVVRGPVRAGARPGQLVLDLSTAAPDSTIALAAELEDRGVQFLDAGISGGAAAAEQGTLTLMIGADQATVDRVAWVLEPFAAKLVAMGRVGAGHSTKLLNNFLNAIALSATAEVMVAARKAGLDLAAVLDVLNSSSGANFATRNRFPSIIRGDYLEGGLTCDLMTKDVVRYVEHVRALGVPSLNAAGPLASFGLAANLGYGKQISNRVVDAIGDVAGHVRLHEQPGDVEDRGH